MPVGAPARILPMVRCTEPRLTLTDNIGIGDDIVAAAAKKQDARLKAIEEAAGSEVVRLPRRRRTATRTPKASPVEVTEINPIARSLATFIAGGDWSRCQPINATEIVVHNHPVRTKKVRRASRSKDAG